MKIKIDLHYHSTYSDGSASIKQIENKCLKDNIGVCITDHNEIRGSVKLYEGGKVHTVLAMEAGSIEGIEFLIYFKDINEFVYFYKAQIEPFRYPRFYAKLNNSAYNILECAKSLNTFVSLAHPYAYGKKSVEMHKEHYMFLNHIYSMIDAVEVYNGTLTKARNIKGFELMNELNKKLTLGSDGHDLRSLGKVTATLNIARDSYSHIYKALKENKFDTDFCLGKVNRLKTISVISRKHTKCFMIKK